MKAIIYTTPTCVYCHALMDWLEKQGIEIDERDLSNSGVAKTAETELGFMPASVPLTVIDGIQVQGFDRPAIKRIIKKSKDA